MFSSKKRKPKQRRNLRSSQLGLERLEVRSLLSTQPITLADPSFWGASAAGVSGNTSSFANDGQLIAFQSDAGNLTPNDLNGVNDIFVRSVSTGAVTLVSATPGGASGNGPSFNPRLSADGRFVLFESDATNLVPTDNVNEQNVFVRDLQTGTTTLVSVNMAGNGPGNGNSFAEAISADGRVVLFRSNSTNLVGLPTNNVTNLYARDLVAGTTTLVSVNFPGTGGGNNDSTTVSPAVITSDDRFVAFQSFASDLVTNDLNGETSDVFLRDLQLGTTTLVSVNAQGTGSGNNQSTSPVFDPTGRFVAFVSQATDLVANAPTGQQIYVRNLAQGVTVLASTDNTFDNTPPTFTDNPVFSPDSRYVAYEGVLVSGVTSELYARDFQTNTTLLISANHFGDHLSDGLSADPLFSPDSQTVYFDSTGTILTTDNTNGVSQIYARNLQTQSTSLLSRKMDGTAGNGPSSLPIPSPDGQNLAYQSSSTGLVAQDNNGFQDVFILDRSTNVTSLASTRSSSLPPSFTSRTTPTDQRLPDEVSSDGRYVLYNSVAHDLVTNSVQGRNTYRYDRQTGHADLVSVNPDGTGGAPGLAGVLDPAAMSSDGRFVVFDSDIAALVPGLQFENGAVGIFVHDMMQGTIRCISLDMAGKAAAQSGQPFTISPNGRYVAFRTNIPLLSQVTNGFYQVYVYDLQQNALSLVSVSLAGNGGDDNSSLRVGLTSVEQGISPFSADGHLLVFDSRATDLVQGGGGSGQSIYVRDLNAGTTTLVSVAQDGTPGTGQEESISADGSRVVFSTTDVLSPQDTNPFFDVYVRDLASSSTILVSAGTLSSGGMTPTISDNGRSVLFTGEGVGPLSLLLRDLQASTPQTVFTEPSGSGTTDFKSVLSGNGRFVAFESLASTIAPGDTPGTNNLFLYDVQAQTITPVDLNHSGTATGDQGVVLARPFLTGDGSVLVYASNSDDLVPADINAATDVFAFTRQTGQGSLQGTVFNDINGDAVRDGMEGPLAGWTVFLDLHGTGTLTPDDPTAVTDQNGAYAFNGLAAGNYTVVEVVQSGYRLTAPATTSYLVSLVDGQTISNLNFGDQQLLPKLAVQNIQIPTSGVPGRSVTVSWSVANQGTAAAAGSWQDAVYLSQNPVLDPTASLIGLSPHDGGLAQGASYSGQAIVTLPAVLPGNYYILIQTDRRGQVTQLDRGNDVLASTGTISLTVPTLTLDMPLADQFTNPGEFHYYQIAPPAGQSLEITSHELCECGSNRHFRQSPSTADAWFIRRSRRGLPAERAGYCSSDSRRKHLLHPGRKSVRFSRNERVYHHGALAGIGHYTHIAEPRWQHGAGDRAGRWHSVHGLHSCATRLGQQRHQRCSHRLPGRDAALRDV
jgi:hypothetical protein